jgi:phytoene dehydrogenase-like protein
MSWRLVWSGLLLVEAILLKKGQKVTLIEKSNALGGVMRGIEWGKYHLD